MRHKPDWPQVRQHLIDWWRGDGFVFGVLDRDSAKTDSIPAPHVPDDMERLRTDATYRCDATEYQFATHAFLGDAFPAYDTQIGPGSLGVFLGAKPGFSAPTVWYEPCIDEPDAVGAISFDPQNPWFGVHMALIDESLRRAGGEIPVTTPDLVENLDTLAALRGSEEVLQDLVDRPEWVLVRLEEINQAYFEVFDRIYPKIEFEGGNAFSSFRIWGPGKTAKLQCDCSCMISPAMFRCFVLPTLREQCQWLDSSLYHLDGTTAVQHLNALLEIDELDAIQWTPQAGMPPSGDAEWYDLYRRIREGGKSVQALGVSPDRVLPLLDAVGPEGMFIFTHTCEPGVAEKLLVDVEPYRRG